LRSPARRCWLHAARTRARTDSPPHAIRLVAHMKGGAETLPGGNARGRGRSADEARHHSEAPKAAAVACGSVNGRTSGRLSPWLSTKFAAASDEMESVPPIRSSPLAKAGGERGPRATHARVRASCSWIPAFAGMSGLFFVDVCGSKLNGCAVVARCRDAHTRHARRGDFTPPGISQGRQWLPPALRWLVPEAGQ
jgi:hypothetical protein